jgi:hypothetical protein
MASRQTGKQRSVRIPLDYFKSSDGLARGKALLSVAAVVVCAFWVLGIGWDVRQWPRRAARSRALASHGELARVHTSWDNECEACHVPFTPIDGSSWAGKLVGDGHASDARCQACHAGPPHHATQSKADVPSCARCHQDHQGRDASLIAMSDRNCTGCHAALAAHMNVGAKPSTVESVTAFDGSLAHHPEVGIFRVGAAKDVGTIKFNHALHLTKGMTLVPDGRPIKTVNDLPESDRARYRTPGIRDSDGILLRCDSCHRLDASASSPSNGPTETAPALLPRGGGDYMVPMRYEAQCRACHPMDYDPSLPPMPHGKQPAEMRQILWQSYSARYLDQHPELEASRPTSRPLPGRDDSPAVRKAREWINQKVDTAERVLFGGKRCGECHEIPLALNHAGASAAGRDFVVKGAIPAVWFPKARFDHSAHRAVGCRECHARALPDDPKASIASADVMIPGIATCQRCHAPRREEGRELTGGAGSRCTECHRYHNGDAPLEGRGALARDAATDSTLREFLNGTPETARP